MAMLDHPVPAQRAGDQFQEGADPSGRVAGLPGNDLLLNDQRFPSDLAPRVRVMVGQTVGHFKILDEIGSGGMGVVYKAQDLALNRIVALKSLKPASIDNKNAIARLIREARTASILDHPNICTIYEVSQTQEGQVFIAMAYYEGETLAQTLRKGALPAGQAVKIAGDVAKGLAKAHRHGVIHRDIKPGNIIVTTDDVVKILDFGIAKLESLSSKRPGRVVGTPPYMSPEQLGGGPVDQRADIWAWGIVLFEMLTGRVPFRSTTRRSVLREVSSDQFDVARILKSGVASELVSVLSKALQKNPSDRYLNIEEAISELDLRPPKSHARRNDVQADSGTPSIAVLPFRSMGSDPEDEYFTHGLTEELTDALAGVQGLQVAPRTSVMGLKGARGRRAAAKLGVAMVLEGSVRRSVSRMRINVRLFNTAQQRVLWSQRFDRDITDIFAIQEDIAAHVAETLKVRLGDQPSSHPARRYTENLDAYNLYLKGRYQWNRESPEALFKAVETLQKATEADPGYVLPFCGLGECYLVIGARELLPPSVAWGKARDAVNRALDLDPKLADAHGCLGAVLAINDFDWAAAEREFRYGLELNPESAATRHWYAISVLAPQGRFAEALTETAHAIQNEPLSLIYNSTLGWIYYLSGQFELAAEQCAKTLEIDPHHPDSLWCLGAAHGELRRPQEAVATLRRLEQVVGGIPLVYGSFGHFYARTGNIAEAEKMLLAVQEAGRRMHAAPICESWIYANLPGQQEAALDCLDRAYEERDFLIRYIKTSPSLKPLYPHPRFAGLVRKMGLDELPTTVSIHATAVAG
jgi:serine/threonine protein kinase/Flp pilus assembly protein TadD